MNEKEIQLLNQLAAKIKSRRLELNLSQEALADKCSLDRTYISLVERSKRNPSYLTLIKISEGLEIDIKKLLGE
ncbi:helix-turn-helix domain-containing protein [Aliarcobacter butzleri]|uniref:helix-turn-helix domain-containing protein n=1 Tax=Aliarcobacter butzleri TaxID=28197 RepID=UPI0021B2C3DD|nr:helix-turn-helix transcriptional regulator [Aliarcobacter butzleri]MCT7646682.1 helix-turn-helix transcriptional regulator [Aliarcobacter butzleri]